MAIYESLEKEIPEALRAGDETQLRTLRSLFSAMTNEAILKNAAPTNRSLTVSERMQITEHRTLSDEDALIVMRKAAHQREDSIKMFEEAGRTDLAEAEKAELAIIQSYLPKLMSCEEIKEVAIKKKAEHGYSLKADTGAFIGTLMKEFKGKADGSDVKAVVDSLLS